MADSGPDLYIGRFAPSPTGPLHFGSLVAAVASYLDARAAGGMWLVRMEDIDPPREVPGAASEILRGLDHFGLGWDGAVLYQSTRLTQYADALNRLTARDLIFPCSCPRTPAGRAYDGTCRARSMADLPGGEYALRVKVTGREVMFHDLLQGEQRFRLDLDPGDFVVKRKDGLFAYQLAVVVDDEWQRVTRVVRGIDLLDSTPRQLYLQQLLGYGSPQYAHFPVITDSAGNKLSKQTGAAPVTDAAPEPYLSAALSALGLQPPQELREASASELLAWGVAHWALGKVPATTAIADTALPYLIP